MKVQVIPSYAPTVEVDGHRVVVVCRDGQRFEIVEQMTGGVSIVGASTLGSTLTIDPVAANTIIVRTK